MLQGLLSSFDLNHFYTRPRFSKKEEVGTVSEREVCTLFVDSPVEEYVHTVAAELSGPYIIIIVKVHKVKSEKYVSFLS